MNYDGLNMDQINDSLTKPAACASAVAYIRQKGLVFISYITGLPKRQ